MCNQDWVLRMRQHPAIVRCPTCLCTKSPSVALPDLELIFTDNEPADTPSANEEGCASSRSSHISSSPNRGPHTGPDGIFREPAGRGAGYELENAEDIEADDIEHLLSEAIKILPTQAKNPNPHFICTSIKGSLCGTFKCYRELAIEQDDARYMRDTKGQVQGLVQWVHAIKYEESHCTMRKTNIHRSARG
ncbi:hypothetical protein C8Q79DRAFT_929392 [Trametes meyenii]|nr:hypothetical protein C8Q79DRAFT_929392 [Trametes meyenii]